GIPAQWQRFVPHLGSIPGQIGQATYGVRSNNDDEGGFDYVCGVAVSGYSNVPSDWNRLRIAAQKVCRVLALRSHLDDPVDLERHLEHMAAGIRPRSGRCARFRALRRSVRLTHRDGWTRDLASDQGMKAQNEGHHDETARGSRCLVPGHRRTSA